MEREIKFRAMYDDMGGGWRYGMLIYEGSVPRIQHKGTMTFSTCLKGTEGQFTGLHDKNGKEIYEGDIVRKDTYSTGYCLPIVWRQQMFQLGEKGTSPLYEDEYEIIGNIYENPELLNNK